MLTVPAHSCTVCFSKSCDSSRCTRWSRTTRVEVCAASAAAPGLSSADGFALAVSTAFVDLLPALSDAGRYPPTILSTYFTVALHLPSSVPHVSVVAFDVVQQSERWSAEQRRLPGAEELARSSWEVLFRGSLDDEKAALLGGALAGSSLETKRAALSILEAGPPQLLQRTADVMYRVVLDVSQAGDVRVQAAKLLHVVSSSSFDANFEEVAAAQQETAIVPLREALLPIVASAACSEAPRSQALRIIEQASGVDEVRSLASRSAPKADCVCFSPLNRAKLPAPPSSASPSFTIPSTSFPPRSALTSRFSPADSCKMTTSPCGSLPPRLAGCGLSRARRSSRL